MRCELEARRRYLRGTPEPFRSTDLRDELERLVSQHRRSLGLHPLTVDPVLALAAGRHALRMRNAGYFAHIDPETGTDPMARVSAVEPDTWRLVAENLTSGVWTPQQALEGWLDSPGHRANLEHAGARSWGPPCCRAAPRVQTLFSFTERACRTCFDDEVLPRRQPQAGCGLHRGVHEAHALQADARPSRCVVCALRVGAVMR